jgi:hypothetical protein
LQKNFDQKVVSAGKWGMVDGKFWIFCGFDVHFASFSVWNLTFLRNVWVFHFCSMWILTTTTFHSPKVHFHGGKADIFPLCGNSYHYFIEFWSAIFTKEQIRLQFYLAVLYFKENCVLQNFKFQVLRVLILTQNGEMKVSFNKTSFPWFLVKTCIGGRGTLRITNLKIALIFTSLLLRWNKFRPTPAIARDGWIFFGQFMKFIHKNLMR